MQQNLTASQAKSEIQSMKNQLEEMYGLEEKAEHILDAIKLAEEERCYEHLQHEEQELLESNNVFVPPKDIFTSTPKFHVPENVNELESSNYKNVEKSDIIEAEELLAQIEDQEESEGQLGQFKSTLEINECNSELKEAELVNNYTKQRLELTKHYDDSERNAQEYPTYNAVSSSAKEGKLAPAVILSNCCDRLDLDVNALAYEKAMQRRSPEQSKITEIQRIEPSEYKLSKILSLDNCQYKQYKLQQESELKTTLKPKITTKAEGALVHARALSRQNERSYDNNVSEWNKNLKEWKREQENDMLRYRKYK